MTNSTIAANNTSVEEKADDTVTQGEWPADAQAQQMQTAQNSAEPTPNEYDAQKTFSENTRVCMEWTKAAYCIENDGSSKSKLQLCCLLACPIGWFPGCCYINPYFWPWCLSRQWFPGKEDEVPKCMRKNPCFDCMESIIDPVAGRKKQETKLRGFTLQVDESGPGFPMGLLDPEAFVNMRNYCHDNDITQSDLERLYARFKRNIESNKHPDDTKKRTERVSLAAVQDEFDFLNVESVSQLFIPTLFVQKIEGVRNSERDDIVDFSRFSVACYEFGRKNTVELLAYFFSMILPSYKVDPFTVLQFAAVDELLLALHGELPPHMEVLIDVMKRGRNSFFLGEFIKWALFFPPILYPVIEFQRSFRKKCYGTKFWAAENRVNSFEDEDTAELVETLRLGDVIFHTFDDIRCPQDAWKVASYHLYQKLRYDERPPSMGGRKKKKKHKKHRRRGHHHHDEEEREDNNALEDEMWVHLDSKLWPLVRKLPYKRVTVRKDLDVEFGTRMAETFYGLLDFEESRAVTPQTPMIIGDGVAVTPQTQIIIRDGDDDTTVSKQTLESVESLATAPSRVPQTVVSVARAKIRAFCGPAFECYGEMAPVYWKFFWCQLYGCPLCWPLAIVYKIVDGTRYLFCPNLRCDCLCREEKTIGPIDEDDDGYQENGTRVKVATNVHAASKDNLDLPWTHADCGPTFKQVEMFWTKVHDPLSNKYFWYNKLTRESQWTRPEMRDAQGKKVKANFYEVEDAGPGGPPSTESLQITDLEEKAEDLVPEPSSPANSVSTLGTEGGRLSVVAAQEDAITVGDAEPEDTITAADADAEAEAGAAGWDTQVLAIESGPPNEQAGDSSGGNGDGAGNVGGATQKDEHGTVAIYDAQ